jgi:putative redox protein
MVTSFADTELMPKLNSRQAGEYMAVESTKIIEGFAFEVQTREFRVRTDVEQKLGGTNTAPDPHDYLQIALAACTAITVQMYAQRKGIPLEYADVKIKIIAEGPVNEILREIKFIGDLSEEQKQALLMIAQKCPIHKFLSSGAGITTQVL